MGSDAATRYFASRRARIADAIEALANRRARELSATPGGAAVGMGRIAEFCLRGKMIRGCLVFLGAEAAGGRADADIAAAMELFQAGLLVHDDIMDRDETRRGAPTIHARYAAEVRAAGAAEYLHIGEGLGICVGDLCYFEAFAALSRALAGHARCAEIAALCAELLSEVAVAQMADLRWAASEEEPGEADILAMYRCKTARYSFSLPLAVGALSAGASGLVGPMTELGERLGILFQIRDDELGLFGSEERTGKPIGSDLREGKKTLFRARLLAAAPREELPRLEALFGGSAEAAAEDLAYIGDLARKLGVTGAIAEMTREAERRARDIIRVLPGLKPDTAEALEGLVDYVGRRDR